MTEQTLPSNITDFIGKRFLSHTATTFRAKPAHVAEWNRKNYKREALTKGHANDAPLIINSILLTQKSNRLQEWKN